MAHWRRFFVAAVGALSIAGAGTISVGADEDNLLEFESMTPVTGLAVGNPNDRGIIGGGLPWTIREGSGHLDRQGNLEVEVEGLIIPLPVVNGQPGNPIPAFSAVVSCLTPTGVVNSKPTAPFPATVPGGDSEIEAHVNLPRTCNSPEVFVGFSPAPGVFRWFARSNAVNENEQ